MKAGTAFRLLCIDRSRAGEREFSESSDEFGLTIEVCGSARREGYVKWLNGWADEGGEEGEAGIVIRDWPRSAIGPLRNGSFPDSGDED